MGWGPFQFPIGPPQASEHALAYDQLFGVITLLTIFFTVAVSLVVVFLAVRYRKGNKVDRSNPLHHHTGLEMVWTIVPLIMSFGIFYWSMENYIKVRTMPDEAKEIFAIGKQWMWHFEHMDGIRENNELHVPVGKPIKMTMISQDVIHAMYLPEMRAQYHVVPGRYTDLAFTPIKEGEYRILCAMHCGTQHSEMVGKLIVMNNREYSEWVERQGNRFKPKPKTMVQAGKDVWDSKGCGNCHTGEDQLRAPTLVGLKGKTRKFVDGSTAVADRDYIRESILHPWQRITAGYENTMQAYNGQLTEEEVLAVTEYIGTMSGSSGNTSGSGMQPYKKPVRGTEPGQAEKKTEVDIANQAESAGVSQFRSTETIR